MPDEPDRATSSTLSDRARQRLDLRGLKCPLPVLQTKRALAAMPTGAVLEVCCSDPLASLDIPNFLRESGDELLASQRRDGEITFTIRRGERRLGSTAVAGEDPSAPAGVDPTQ